MFYVQKYKLYKKVAVNCNSKECTDCIKRFTIIIDNHILRNSS